MKTTRPHRACPPQVRYRLTGVSAASAALPDLNAFLTRALSDCVCAAALWPRRVIFPILPDLDPSTLIPAPAGVLRVSVLCDSRAFSRGSAAYGVHEKEKNRNKAAS